MNDECNEFVERALEQLATQIKRVVVKSGDILHVRAGIGGYDMGDGQPPWIPGPEELDAIRNELGELVPEGVKLYVTHQGVEIDAVISDDIER